MSAVNLVDVLSQRGISTSIQHRERMEILLEKRFMEAPQFFDYDLKQDLVLSTISISISPDGEFVASTHGDHTVKIFQHDTGKLIHAFHGHPRTPWTVKFHPTDSNCLASGCLGCEVRVWDVEKRLCRAFIRVGFSIISVAFQPNGGPHLAIASGPQLLLWDWKTSSTPKEDDSMYSSTQNQPAYPNQIIEPVLVHSRNIRAVIFHPLGTIAFAAAPDPPRQSNSAPAPCRLYSLECSLLGNKNNVRIGLDGQPVPIHPPSPLDSMPTLIPQIHLYSDGGLDISKDGEYIFACAIMATKRAVDIPPHSCGDRSPPVPLPSSSSSSIFGNNISSYFGRESNRTSSYGDEPNHHQRDSTSNSEFSETESEENSDEELHFSISAPKGSEEGGDINKLATSMRNLAVSGRKGRENPIVGTKLLQDAITGSMQLTPLPPSTQHMPVEDHSWGLSSFLRVRPVSNTENASFPVVTDGTHLLSLLDPHKTPYPSDWSVQERLCLFKVSVLLDERLSSGREKSRSRSSSNSSNRGGRDPKTVTIVGSFNDADVNMQYCDSNNDDADPYSVRNNEMESGNDDNMSPLQTFDETVIRPVCAPKVDLVQSRHLPGALMRAVTSMKLSPSGRLGLVGYGVRVFDNVLHHTNEKVSCEILDLTSKMTTSCLLTDEIDEINIAQFHPIPGCGVLYGTKRGKVRVFHTADNN